MFFGKIYFTASKALAIYLKRKIFLWELIFAKKKKIFGGKWWLLIYKFCEPFFSWDANFRTKIHWKLWKIRFWNAEMCWCNLEIFSNGDLVIFCAIYFGESQKTKILCRNYFWKLEGNLQNKFRIN